MVNVAERLIYLRKKKGITTNKLANLSEISQSHVREIERGTRNPTVETLSYFCDVLGVRLSEFFNEADNELNEILISSLKKLSEQQQLKLADFYKRNNIKGRNSGR